MFCSVFYFVLQSLLQFVLARVAVRETRTLQNMFFASMFSTSMFFTSMFSAPNRNQCVAVCCSVLQCVAVCCSVLQCVGLFGAENIDVKNIDVKNIDVENTFCSVF